MKKMKRIMGAITKAKLLGVFWGGDSKKIRVYCGLLHAQIMVRKALSAENGGLRKPDLNKDPAVF
jgi:hypothetical protein